jgi:phosphate transport system substrate-binding protein
MIKRSFLMASVAIASLAAAGTAQARDHVQVAGSSTVLPYASIVAEAFGENTDFPTPVVESGGSSAGLKRFCEGVGENTIDIANASRAIRDREIKACAENGVTDIIEVRIGYDGIVFASQQSTARPSPPSAVRHLQRLAPKVMVDGELVDNPHTPVVRLQRRSAGRKSLPSSRAPSTAPAKSSKRRFSRRAVKPPAPWKP